MPEIVPQGLREAFAIASLSARWSNESLGLFDVLIQASYAPELTGIPVGQREVRFVSQAVLPAA